MIQEDEVKQEEEKNFVEYLAETINQIKEEHIPDLKKAISKKYSSFIKGSCTKCNGTGTQYVFINRQEDCMYPYICKCVQKKSKKEHLELLSDILIDKDNKEDI